MAANVDRVGELLPNFGRLAPGTLLDHLGFEFLWLRPEAGAIRCEVGRIHLNPRGTLHGGTMVALADTICGTACLVTLPPGASGFTTIELKSNFIGTARAGDAVVCEAQLVHGGRTTQVWDATLTVEESRRRIALFRCTQAILYPRDASTAEGSA